VRAGRGTFERRGPNPHRSGFQQWLGPAGEGTIGSEDRVSWNFKVPRAGEIIFLEKHQIVLIGGKKGTEFGTTG